LHKRRSDLRNAYSNVFSLGLQIGQCLSLPQFKYFWRIRAILFKNGCCARATPRICDNFARFFARFTV
jgi:hypothetical protein